MHILVLQHAVCEHPGSFRNFLRDDGHSWVSIELDEGEPLPSIEGFEALWVLGGPMDVWEEDKHPWLIAEKEFIRDAVRVRGLPFLGLCLGHQLLAEALGGACGKSETPEIGVLDVRLTEDGMDSVFLDGLPEVFKCLQWHGAEVSRMPEGARCLATTRECRVQAMQWGPRAHSVQFHLEIEDDTVANWALIPEYADALRDALGTDGEDQLGAACAAEMPGFLRHAERVYINWLQTAAQGTGPGR